MPGVWIERRATARGETRYRVRFRIGGRESVPGYGGSFRTKREAELRRMWIAGELAARRVPDLSALDAAARSPTLAAIAERWKSTRVDVAEGTAATYRVNLGRILPRLGERPVDEISADDVAALVGKLHAEKLARESIRKTLATFAMVLDAAGIDPNPARDRLTVKLPRETKAEPQPPTAEHVLAVHRLLAPAYRLPLLVLDATGMRVGELEALTWGDVNETRSRWRISKAVAKTGRARYVTMPAPLFAAVLELCPRDDRTPERRVFQGVTADRLRTAIARACIAAGVPAFSPHDLRHRRISLDHLRGVPWAKIGELVGQRNLAVTANTYTHVLTDEQEVEYSRLA
ncbi:MAG: tyrosine-type recombinase/integrase [Actinobacteria bacterium]|nr:tyrosine-type recombinase/integrase [Actinomycetota bacterium]